MEDVPTPPPVTPAPTTFYISPNGDDHGLGTETDPFRSFNKALSQANVEKVIAAAGHYPEDLAIGRVVELAGPSDGSGSAALDGKLDIHAAASVHGVDVSGGLSIRQVAGVTVSSGRIGAGTQDTALLVDHAVAQLAALTVGGGAENGVLVSTATVHADGLTLTGDGQVPNRALRVVSSSVTVRHLTVGASKVADVQLELGAVVSILDSQINGPSANGLIAITNSTLDVERTQVTNYSQTALLATSSLVKAGLLVVGRTDGVGIGIGGADVTLTGLQIDPCLHGAITVNNVRRPAKLTMIGGVVNHGASMGLNIGGGTVQLQGTRFSGDPTVTGQTGDDAISAFGGDASMRLDGVVSDAAPGYAVGVYSGATATISATITRPHLGGVFIDSTPGVSQSVRNTSVDSCKLGSGIVAFDSTDVTVDTVQVKNCPEAGVMAGQNATLRLSNATLTGNRLYGLAAFGGSELTVLRSTASGSPQAVFATCADGARVIDAGGNTFRGPVTTCP
jgi:hypothetical protein